MPLHLMAYIKERKEFIGIGLDVTRDVLLKYAVLSEERKEWEKKFRMKWNLTLDSF